MSFLDAFRHRLNVLRRGETYADDQAREVQFHLELAALGQPAHDPNEPDAELAAHREFGNVTRYREEAREMSALNWLDRIRQDLAYAWRGLRRGPGFTAAVVVTLGLGIGLNAAVFTLLDRVFVRPPVGVSSPRELRRLYVDAGSPGGRSASFIRSGFPYSMFMTMAAVLGDSNVATYTYGDSVGIEAPTTETMAKRSYISPNYFSLLGVPLRLGRTFSADEGRPDRPSALAVISDDLWRRAFHGDLSIVGHSMRIDDEPFTIVGVAAPGFTGLDLDRVDVWTTLGSFRTRGWDDGEPWYKTSHGFEVFRGVTRMPLGFEMSPLEADITARMRAANSGDPGSYDLKRVIDGPIVEALGPIARQTETSVALRIAAVALIVLLIACANVANLLLLRGARRGHEIAIRRALGVSRLRLGEQVIVESVLLATLGGTTALTLAYWGGELLRHLLFPSIRWSGGVVDLRVIVFLAAVAIIVGLVAGVVPAIAAANPDVMAVLRRGSQGGGSRGSRVRSALVVVQTALGVVLLVGAILFVRSLRNVEAIGVGYDTREVAFGGVYSRPGDKSDALRALTAQLVDIATAMRSFPGVKSTAVVSVAPLRGTLQVPTYRPNVNSTLRIGRLPPVINAVTHDYFETVGIARVAGRMFTEHDVASSMPVMVVDRRMANAVWPGQSAVGQCLILRLKTNPCVTVVGVVENVHVSRFVEPPAARYYVPIAQAPMAVFSPSIVIRASPSALSRVTGELRTRILSVVPEKRRIQIATLSQLLEPELRPWLVGAQLFTAIGVLALIVAGVGIFSVASYAMSQRTHEIGLRLALGAHSIDIFGLAARSGLAVLAFGAALGVAVAVLLSRFVASLLFGIKPTDLSTLLGAALLLFAVGVVAALGPAWRASQIDPARTLNTE